MEKITHVSLPRPCREGRGSCRLKAGDICVKNLSFDPMHLGGMHHGGHEMPMGGMRPVLEEGIEHNSMSHPMHLHGFPM
ncbi:MAG: hypothetical protein ACK4M3_03225 [Pyrobaculum sp.]